MKLSLANMCNILQVEITVAIVVEKQEPSVFSNTYVHSAHAQGIWCIVHIYQITYDNFTQSTHSMWFCVRTKKFNDGNWFVSHFFSCLCATPASS